MQRSGYLPNIDRLSMLTATILLAYALAVFVKVPERQTVLELFSFSINIHFTLNTFLPIIVAGLTATGTVWLLRDHPSISGKRTVQHWLLPALTAWVISLPLLQLPVGIRWWIGFLLAGLLLVFVIVAEYIVVDPQDIRQPPAAASLTAISFALFLVLATALRFAGTRLFILLFAIGTAVSLVSLRTLLLRLHGYWAFVEAGVIAFIITQLAAAIYFWPLPPVSFGLLLLGPAYALTNFIGNLSEGELVRQAAIEPSAILVFVWVTAIWIR